MRALRSAGSIALRAAPIRGAHTLYRRRALRTRDEDLDLAVALEGAREPGHQIIHSGVAAATEKIADHGLVLNHGIGYISALTLINVSTMVALGSDGARSALRRALVWRLL
jgi:hypothetical protein